MLKELKQLFCKHNFIEKCKIDDYTKEYMNETVLSYQDVCLSRIKNNHCKKHDAEGNLLGGYCDYYYQECSKCGKIKDLD